MLAKLNISRNGKTYSEKSNKSSTLELFLQFFSEGDCKFHFKKGIISGNMTIGLAYSFLFFVSIIILHLNRKILR